MSKRTILILSNIIFILFIVLVSCGSERPATLQILSVVNRVTGERIKTVDVYVQPDDIGPGQDGDIFMDVLAPIVIPIGVGKCSYILIEAEGYKDWEEAFCPTEGINIPVNITLIPIGEPLPVKNKEARILNPILNLPIDSYIFGIA